MAKMLKPDTILVSFEPSTGEDMAILIVGRKNPRQNVDIINAFQGKEAIELYKKLVTEAPKGKVIFDVHN